MLTCDACPVSESSVPPLLPASLPPSFVQDKHNDAALLARYQCVLTTYGTLASDAPAKEKESAKLRKQVREVGDGQGSDGLCALPPATQYPVKEPNLLTKRTGRERGSINTPTPPLP